MDDQIAAIRARVNNNMSDTLTDDPADFMQEQLIQARHDCRVLLDHIDQQQTALQRETDWHNQVAEIVEGIVAHHMGGQPDPETTPTLDLLRAIDAALTALKG